MLNKKHRDKAYKIPAEETALRICIERLVLRAKPDEYYF